MANVFISYQELDRISVERLSMELRARGYYVIASHLSETVGDSIIERIGHEPSGKSILVLVIPEVSSTGSWIDREWMSALARQLEQANVQVLPVTLSGRTGPPILADTKYADLGYDWNAGLSTIIKTIDPEAFVPDGSTVAPVIRNQRFSSSVADEEGATPEKTAGQPGERLAALAPGSVVAGRYRLEEAISAGAKEAVLPARDELLDRHVTLRVVVPPPNADPEWRGRLAREINIAARVRHPSIFPVDDLFDGPDDTTFIVTPLVHGKFLSEILARERRLSAQRTADIISALASALDEVHRAGVVHRDVKPANILVESHGELYERVYLTDFGIALLDGSEDAPGTVIGAPGYMPPEQISGDRVDHRADQYALAVTAFSMLTGEMPFQSDSMFGMLYEHLNESPLRATSLRSDLPPEIDPVFARALAKSRNERFSSVGEFAKALRTALMTSGSPRASQVSTARTVAQPSDDSLRTPGHQQGSTGSEARDARDEGPVSGQRTWDEALDGFPPGGLDRQSHHRGDAAPIGGPPGIARSLRASDFSGTGNKPHLRSWVRAFADGLGEVFDIFGGIERQRWNLPAFEDTLVEDARALCLELGLISQSGDGSREGTH